ncbi:MAG: MFS transporter [Rhodobacteraceae bacterium]|nr:MFS transporter [Paracoccaceae bacterium]
MTTPTNRKAIWGWYFFDWAAQPYHTLLVTFIFGPYFVSSVVGDPVLGQALWARMMWIVGLFLALSAPVLGAIADSNGPRKPWIALFSVVYIVCAASLWIATPGMNNFSVILVAFGVGFAAVELAQVLINAILPTLGPREELGRISGSGWAFGYVGGLLTLIIMLLFLAEGENGLTLLGTPPVFGLDAAAREGTRSVGPLTAIWYAVFLIPFFLWVPDVVQKSNAGGAIVKGLRELKQTLANLPNNTSLAAYLGSSMFYRDALNGLYTFGGIYAAGVLGWSVTQIGIFGIVAIITGAIFSWLGGYADRKYGPKVVITCSVVALIIVCTLIIGTSRSTFFGTVLSEGSTFPDSLFMFCGAVIGGAGGILQAASRTMLVHQAEPDRVTEAFGLYALSGRATAFLAPALIDLVTTLTSNQRLGLTPVILLFIIGLVLLFWVRSAEEYR